MMKAKFFPCCLALIMMAGVAQAQSRHVGAVTRTEINPVAMTSGPTRFAMEQIQATLLQRDLAELSISLQLDEALGEQAYGITRDGSDVTVTGGDPRGVMYGGLELAERIRLGKVDSLTTLKNKPFLAKRGIKFNIPLDARTPSYADSGDAAQRNIAEMWNWDFWSEFLDNMALHRYNALTLWNPHPFPVMTKIPGYEDAALPDVTVCTLDLKTEKYQWGPIQLVSEPLMENLKVVKTMTIEEKIDFWRRVMRYAKDRGIDIYFITWNICPNGVANPVKLDHTSWQAKRDEEAPGKYGVTHQIDNPKTLAYYRAAIKSFILTYPDLKGFGITAGENMPADEEGVAFTREKWLWEAYGLGILDAKKEQPWRKVDFIHRVWYSDMDKIMQYWGQYPDSFEVSFKYAKARLYSSPRIPFTKSLIKDIEPLGLKSWWNLRNDDIFIHRWGDPDYVRAFLQDFPQDFTAGYHMGSDGYVWGREFVSKDTSTPAPLEITKHWYSFLLWGRLGYDPKLDKGTLQDLLAERFPGVSGGKLYIAWQAASKIIPTVNRFHWRDWDFMWAVEGCKDGAYRTIIDFYDNPTMEQSYNVNAKTYVETTLAKGLLKANTPLQIADTLDQLAAKALSRVPTLLNSSSTPELTATVLDCQSMAWLGQFYADKIRATVAYGFLKETADEEYRKEALAHLENGLKHWSDYTTNAEARYHDQVLSRTGTLSWAQLRKAAADEITMVSQLTLSTEEDAK
jgi:hypothetical protein